MTLVTPASFPTDLPAITQLFRAYATSLPIDLGYQDFDGELASLPGKYAAPHGAYCETPVADTVFMSLTL
ncbi:MAG: hypothetical protein KF779_04700 [Hyphomonadaceae bacterium]|nr:hypothetical protein [Hyphomonadaceae bacterium]